MITKPISPFIVSIAGKILTGKEVALLQALNPLGVILFARNIQSKDQLRALTASIQQTLSRKRCSKIPIWIDMEGGSVNRLRQLGSMNYPSQMYYGDIAKQDKNWAQKILTKNLTLMAHDLVALGINTNCAPVLDLGHDTTAPFLQKRIFSHQPSLVQFLGKLAVRLFHGQGIVPVIKHLPGHGRARVDSHTHLPIVGTPLAELEQTDFEVFRCLNQLSFPMIGMVAHVCYASIDRNHPATTSKKTIQYIRENVFSGILASDAIDMEALSGTIAEKTLKVLKSGIDLVLYCGGHVDEMQTLLHLTQSHNLHLNLTQLSHIEQIYVEQKSSLALWPLFWVGMVGVGFRWMKKRFCIL